ncbi:NUDIX domain-containing protein [Thermomonas sp.]|uniref:NUDIX hydrolase n=1 Tax=Thermomonas sp. TaxID=1971895 RepID=UPI002D1DDBAE|nr:NUDIX domain-containing protein [Thermomonas sp.]HRO62385.1 NUDIX domain-containing protein [Thermomonas sp.]
MSERAVRCTMVSVLALRRGATPADARVLLVRRAGSTMAGTWTYVAGHIEDGEAAWQTALRELGEETALVPQSLHATSFCERFYDASADCIQIVPAFVAQIAPDAQVRLNAEHSEFAWLPLPEARERMPFGEQRLLLDHLREEFILRRPHPVLEMGIGASGLGSRDSGFGIAKASDSG